MEDLRADPLLAKITEVKGYKVLPPCVVYARIGQGGMGAVYRGHHLNLDIDVAVKCLKPSLVADDPTFVDRFRREGRSAAKINHQNVIRVFDVAENLGLHYLIMEYVQGETARQRVERKGPLAVAEALQVVYEASLGLGEAHRLGIVHRDIKPDNLLISSRGQVKVADLGLAKPAVGSGQSMLSIAGQVMGTPPYMPPEQWNGSMVTAAADVWAMGATLYYLLSSQEAITGTTLANIMSRIVLQPFPDIRKFRQDVPDSVAQLLEKATQKEPGERYLDASELADAIAALPEHRVTLGDTEAGTTELRTMLSPPPMMQIEEIKQLLREDAETRRQGGSNTVGGKSSGGKPAAKAGKAKPKVRPADATGRRAPWLLGLLLLLAAAGGTGAYLAWNPADRGEPGGGGNAPSTPAPPTPNIEPDRLAEADQFEQAGDFGAALTAARAAFAADASLPDQSARIDRLLRAAAADLTARLQRTAPTAPVAPDTLVEFVGRLDSGQASELLLGGRSVALQRDGSFSASRRPAADASLTVQVTLTSGDTVDLAPWRVTFATPPLTFVGALATDPPLPDGICGEREVVLVGKLNDAEAELLLGGEVLSKVEWRPDGSFRVPVSLPNEGRNELVLAARRVDGAAIEPLRLTVVRLTTGPVLQLLEPAAPTFETKAEQIDIEVEADEWTTEVQAISDIRTIELERVAPTGTRWRTKAAVELRDRVSTFTITASNRAGLTRQLVLTITCTAPPPSIESVTLKAVGKPDLSLTEGDVVYTNSARVSLQVAASPQVRLQLDGKPMTANPVPLALREGEEVTVVLTAKSRVGDATEWRSRVVLDSKPPLLVATDTEPVAPGAKVVLEGTWSDNVGIERVTVDGRPAVIPDLTGRNGRWSLEVTAGDRDDDVTVVAFDRAGNKDTATVTLRIAAAQPVKPVVLEPEQPSSSNGKPAAAQPASEVRQFPGFEAVPGCKINEAGYPEELRHQKSGIVVVAIGLRARTAPDFYVATRMVTERQWNGAGTDKPQVSISGRTILTEIRQRLPSLGLPTAREWAALIEASNSKVEDTADGGFREWLAPANVTDSAWPIRKDPSVTSAPNSSTSPYRGFRVVFRPQ